MFMIFEVKFEMKILVTLAQEVEQKSEWFSSVNFFLPNSKVDLENGICTKLPFLIFIFCSHATI